MSVMHIHVAIFGLERPQRFKPIFKRLFCSISKVPIEPESIRRDDASLVQARLCWGFPGFSHCSAKRVQTAIVFVLHVDVAVLGSVGFQSFQSALKRYL